MKHKTEHLWTEKELVSFFIFKLAGFILKSYFIMLAKLIKEQIQK